MMPQRRFFLGRSMPSLVSMLMVSACSTTPMPMPIAPSIPTNLLTSPPDLPAFPRRSDGTLAGGQCLVGALDLYAAAGAIRLQLMTLQAMLREQQRVAQ